MKLILAFALLVSLPLSAQEDNPFDNWLHKFFEGESESFGDIMSPDGVQLDQGVGKTVTTIDLKNKTVKMVSTFRFKNTTDKLKSVSIEKPKGKNTFTGKGKDSTGGEGSYTLTIIDEKNYKSEVKAANGITVSIKGTLTNKDTIESIEKISGPDGNHVLTSKVTYKRAKKPKK